ncbi:uncharacterized protein AB9W97_002584 isoform 1-T1 [Spinachia spinachia]
MVEEVKKEKEDERQDGEEKAQQRDLKVDSKKWTKPSGSSWNQKLLKRSTFCRTSRPSMATTTTRWTPTHTHSSVRLQCACRWPLPCSLPEEHGCYQALLWGGSGGRGSEGSTEGV